MTLIVISLFLVLAGVAHAGHRSDTARKLNRGLASTPLHGQGYLIERAGHTFGIHPAFLAAITGLESSYAAASCRSNPRNGAGLGSCSGSWVPFFRTWGHFWSFLARFIDQRWHGVSSPWSVGYSYCPPCGGSWGDRVAMHMRRLGFAPTVIYPKGS